MCASFFFFSKKKKSIKLRLNFWKNRSHTREIFARKLGGYHLSILINTSQSSSPGCAPRMRSCVWIKVDLESRPVWVSFFPKVTSIVFFYRLILTQPTNFKINSLNISKKKNFHTQIVYCNIQIWLFFAVFICWFVFYYYFEI